MNLDDYRTAWQNDPAPLPTELKGLMQKMTRTARLRRGILICMAINTSLALLVTAWLRPSLEHFPLLVLQAVLALGLAWLIKDHLSRNQALATAVSSVSDATRRGLAEVQREIQTAKMLLAVGALAIPLFGVIVAGLESSGKMRASDVYSFAAVCTVIFAVNIGIRWWRHQRTLVPRRARLESILASLGE